MIDVPPAPLKLQIDGEALRANWQWFAQQSGTARCGAAIKADGYGLGAREVLRELGSIGCRDFFVATWAEAAELLDDIGDAALSVLHGVREEDLRFALESNARPVLNTPEQIMRWKAAGGGVCDVMIDTGMNRLGLDLNNGLSHLLDGLEIDTLCSHLACADEDHDLNGSQLARFVSLKAQFHARRYSLANSAGVLLGNAYTFDLTRPGLGLYGGVPRAEAAGHVRQVVKPLAQVLQRRSIAPGETVGYGATFKAISRCELAVLNLGYADGYLRAFAGSGELLFAGLFMPIVGRVSMDMIVADVTKAPDVREGDWLEIVYDLPSASARTALSQYELLTGLGHRYDRQWV